MKKYIPIAISLFATLILTGCATNRAPYHIPNERVAVLIGQDNQTIHDYVEATKHIPAGFMVYTSIQNMDGLDDWSADRGSGRFNAAELLEKYPGKAIQIGLYMVDALKMTYTGELDGNIDRMVRWLKAAKAPVLLRIGYEFDGPHNHYDPQDYKKAYVYLVDKLRAAGVDNVAYVWHSYASTLDRDLGDWYPGDDYVDWVGISYFNQPQDLMLPVVQFAQERNKPVMIAEATPRGIGANHGELSWHIWFQPFFRFIESHHIKIISYINSNWTQQPMWDGELWGDARIQSDNFVKETWLNKITEKRYTFSFENRRKYNEHAF